MGIWRQQNRGVQAGFIDNRVNWRLNRNPEQILCGMLPRENTATTVGMYSKTLLAERHYMVPIAAQNHLDKAARP